MTETEMPLVHRNVNKKVEIQHISCPLLFNKRTVYKFISALLIVNISVTFFFLLFRTVPMACGSFQARGPNGAATASHSNVDPNRICNCDLHCSLRQCQNLNPQNGARD